MNTSEQLKAPEGYKDQSIITGDRAGLLMTELMKGTDPQTAVAALTAGTAGHAAEMVDKLARMRSEVMRARLQRVESSVDGQGRNALERFGSIISRKVSERLIANIKKAEKQRLGYHASLTTELMENPDGEYAEYTRRDLRSLFDGKVIQPKPITFITDYKSLSTNAVKIDSDGGFVGDNDLLDAAIEEAATSEFGSYDEECADALDGLLPSKLGLTVSSEGTVSISVDGTELEVPIVNK